MGAMASPITSLTIVYSAVYSGADQRKHQSSASLAPVNSPHKWPVMQKMFPFDDVFMSALNQCGLLRPYGVMGLRDLSTKWPVYDGTKPLPNLMLTECLKG